MYCENKMCALYAIEMKLLKWNGVQIMRMVGVYFEIWMSFYSIVKNEN
jgi:hypothetical protein